MNRLMIPISLLTVGLAGCASEPDGDLLARLTREVRADRAELVRPGVPATLPVELPEAAGPDDYARLATAADPRVAAADARARRLAARVPQVRSLDDPMLTVTPLGDMAETAAGQVDVMAGLSQRLQLPGKYDARGDAAEREAAAAVAGLEQVRLMVAAEARSAFWRYWLADRAIETTQRSRDLLADLREAATAQLRAGRAGQADVLRAATELSALDNELVDLRLDREVAAAALNRLLDRPPDAPLPEPPAGATPDAADAGLSSLLAEAQARNPRLDARAAEVDAARQRLRLARLDYFPDLTIVANYGAVGEDGLAVMANGDDQWSLGFGVNLPIFTGKRRAAVREQTAAVQEGLARLAGEQNDLAFEVREAAAEVEAQRRLVRLFEETILPQARQTVEATAAAYRAGDADFLSYVDAWRRLLDFELSQRRATSDLGRAAADLRRALGQDEPTETK